MTAPLPAIRESGPAARLGLAIAIAASYGLWIGLAGRVWSSTAGGEWWMMPAALLAGLGAADFVSGLVHWGADTWGRDDLPFVGPAVLVPFRVHHVNPDDFQRRRFVDVNGSLAVAALPVLLWLSRIRPDSLAAVAVAGFGLAFCGASMLTNQIHQWAHIVSPPRFVRVLQACRLILARPAHAGHHEDPYARDYCITTGWWNRPLEAVRFFRALERVITAVTGAAPRRDDDRYRQRYG